MKQIRKRLTYANVMSSIAIFLVVGGATAFAALGKNTVGSKQLKKNAVTTVKIKKGAVTGDKLNLPTIGTVPNATHADTATNATNATNATTATNALNLGGTPAASYLKGPLEAVHFVGAPGQPPFENACKNRGGEFQPAGFYKDASGVVHLVGDITTCAGGGASVFTLPEGFRPATQQRYLSIAESDTTVGVIRVDKDGAVKSFSNKTPVLNGMYFRTD